MSGRAELSLFSRHEGVESPAPFGLDNARAATLSVVFLTFAIAILDVCWPRTNVSVFYVVPLLMLAQFGDVRNVGRIVALSVVLTFLAFQVKKVIDPIGMTTSYFHFSLLNRALVAGMLMAVGLVIRLWDRFNVVQSDRGLPEEFRHQDREIGETLAVVSSGALVVALGVVDIISPANYNLAILYPVPLLTCVFVRSRRLLWTIFAVLVALAVFAIWVGPPPTDSIAIPSMHRNRLLAIVALGVVTVILHRWMGDNDA